MVTNEHITNQWFKQYLTDIVFQDKFKGRTAYKVRRDHTTKQDEIIDANNLKDLVILTAYEGVQSGESKEEGKQIHYALGLLFEADIINTIFQGEFGKPVYAPNHLSEEEINQAYEKAKQVINIAKTGAQHQEWMIENATAPYILKP